MKKVLTVLLAGVSALAFAQKKMDLSRSIDDDGKTLSISVHGTVDGKRIDYDHTFSVADLNKEERNDLTDRVLDSLGLEKINTPSPPRPPQAPQAPKPPVHFSAGRTENNAPNMVWEDESEHINTADHNKPLAKEILYNSETGELFMRYQFTKNGEEFIFEKTVDVSQKSAKQRDNIIKDFEREIALPANSIQ
ncbi:hypothetical protein [Dyadobacter sp. NIV53]|uniref:hypothetical protein n=1 Tax=Dyadobacter sp. NIV53 TaxID=2861765 RepID=UPI001C885A5B|nr:hypothetical protein [Dyadobacter sp. NIV53]